MLVNEFGEMGRGESQPKVKITSLAIALRTCVRNFLLQILETKLRETDVDRGRNFYDIKVGPQSNISTM